MPLPIALNEKLTSVYTKHLYQGIQLPVLLFPEIEYCAQGYKFNTENDLLLERTGIMVYTKNDVLEFKDHKGINNFEM